MGQVKQFDVVVLGAGAAGLLCAALAGQRGRRVAVLEHQSRPGRKILISGGGRCNFTNSSVSATNFISENPHFAKSALARFTPGDFLALLKKHKVSWHEKTLGQLFCDDGAQRVLDALLAECRQGGVALRLGVRIGPVRRAGGFVVETSEGAYEARAVVVATGGLSIPKLGATGLAYEVARQFGHKVVEPYPALVPLVWAEAEAKKWSGLAGVSCRVGARCGRASFEGGLLFTHRGLSGPAVLQASSYWRPGEVLEVDWLPGGGGLDLRPEEARRGLETRLPARLARQFLDNEGFGQTLLPLKRLEERLHRWTVTPAGTEGFAKAEVTGGGVDTREISSQTMESRRAPGLHFIGEAVDVTGWLGGYNFQWAWASAHAAASSI